MPSSGERPGCRQHRGVHVSVAARTATQARSNRWGGQRVWRFYRVTLRADGRPDRAHPNCTCASLRLDARLLDDRPPLFDLGLLKRG
jgi:hypothetical protein